ncbi:MAG: FAD-dependent oxidoreductase [Candidatus Aerophobetes bacterium]|nr:FAD-dependent oxidoreductase [Candidatus Aerophobetes bacterium]
MEKNVVVIGGGPAGITAAVSARRYYPDARIKLIRQEEKVLIPCGIPYVLGTVKSPEKNLMPDTVLSNNGIELIVDKVTSINEGAKTLSTVKGDTIGYEKLVLATGSLPLVPPLSGLELDNVFVVKKEINYLQKLLDALDRAKDVVIIGGGFIGLEFADECKKRGIPNVTVIELLPHCLLLACDEEICRRVEEKLQERGINLLTDRKAESIQGVKKVESVQLKNGQKIKADAVILGIGVVPNVELAEKAGLRVDKKAGIWVDDFMRTSDEDILACGDCAEKRCYLSGTPVAIRLASVGTTEARIVGANLFATRKRMECPIGIFSTCFGDLAVGSAGLTERRAKELNIDIATSEVVAPDKHPGGIPGTKKLGVKLIFEKDTGLLIGSQVYGGSSVGELINFIGALIQYKMRADEIATFQMGTHPMLTASPVVYQIINAAEIASTRR